MLRSAEFSEDMRYRHRLDRLCGDGARCGWLMCNPSKAGKVTDDATVRKCVGFAFRWGYDGITIVNSADYITTSPLGLIHAMQTQVPIESAANPEYLRTVAREINLVIVAWGCGDTLKRLATFNFDPLRSLHIMRDANPQLQIECLGLTKHGIPKHPLMLPYSTQRQPFIFGEAQ